MESDDDLVIAFLRLFKLTRELRKENNPLVRVLLTIVQDQRQIFEVTSPRSELDEITATLHEDMEHEFRSKKAGVDAARDYLKKNHPDLYQKMEGYTKDDLLPKPFGIS